MSIFCSGLAIEIIRPRINRIMKAIDSKYSGKANNYLDGIRVLQAYRLNNIVKQNEKKMLLLHLVLNFISHIGLITLIMVLVFGPGLMEILNP